MAEWTELGPYVEMSVGSDSALAEFRLFSSKASRAVLLPAFPVLTEIGCFP